MNWITKALSFGEKIKKVLKKRPSKEDIANSDFPIPVGPEIIIILELSKLNSEIFFSIS